MSEIDVVVVGAGPTGLLLAAELALGGCRVRIVERRASAQRHSRALTLHPRSLEILEQRGIAQRFLAAGSTSSRWHYARLDTELDFAALHSRHPYTLLLAQARTEALLAERVRELGVPIERGVEFTGFAQDDRAVEVEVRSDGSRETFRCGYLVGCDGARSVVRQAAGIGFPGTEETVTGMLGDFVVADQTGVAAAREAGVLVVPLSAEVARFVIMDPQRIRVPSSEPVTEDEFRESLQRLCGTDRAIGDPRWLSRFGNATRIADHYRRGRVLLAGDAAHIHFPAAGQGLNTGLQDAMNLGWKLSAEVAGRAPVGLLDTYEAERRPVARAVATDTEVQTFLAELLMMPEYQRPATALRALLDDLLGIESVNHRLAGRISGLDIRYPGDQGEDPLVGGRMPDIAVVDAGDPPVRISELLHEGRFVLLCHADPRLGDELDGAIRVFIASGYDDCDDLNGVTEILIRPDGHIAWASRQTDPVALRTDRARALNTWVGTGPVLAATDKDA
ncbi:FAD-dependent monooxygenase [Nocardia farcinica]|uniref:FAD-dependent monooxygenase n=1 Tax=Nocardia farcinica TaxID=37329 RepID=UPI001893E817|nr:FAD-dependent monooxygenase [Nocardia farcinica]MBF6271557.1 FAD-dependent monooxygenase [Nocardia farcinica]MCZ9330316.1 FAD-dependent monooxygenase [Nocardia farcinica]